MEVEQSGGELGMAVGAAVLIAVAAAAASKEVVVAVAAAEQGVAGDTFAAMTAAAAVVAAAAAAPAAPSCSVGCCSSTLHWGHLVLTAAKAHTALRAVLLAAAQRLSFAAAAIPAESSGDLPVRLVGTVHSAVELAAARNFVVDIVGIDLVRAGRLEEAWNGGWSKTVRAGADSGSTLIVVYHMARCCPCRNFRQLTDQGLQVHPSQVLGIGWILGLDNPNSSCCMYLRGVPQASGRSSAQPSKAWHVDQAKYLQKLEMAKPKNCHHLPCLLIVSPYVRANFGRSLPILSYSS